jgi:hypothetical protein
LKIHWNEVAASRLTTIGGDRFHEVAIQKRAILLLAAFIPNSKRCRFPTDPKHDHSVWKSQRAVPKVSIRTRDLPRLHNNISIEGMERNPLIFPKTKPPKIRTVKPGILGAG